MSFNTVTYLHVYAQHMPHDQSFIVGNRTALLELRAMIDEALRKGESRGDFGGSDGEGYEVYIINENDERLFESIEMPYTEQFGEVNSHMYFVNEIADGAKPASPVTLLKENKERP